MACAGLRGIEEQQPVVDHVNETVTLVDWKEQPPRFVRSCTIFEEDLQLLCPLLGAWPAMVPYARLVALMAGPELAQQVEEAQSAGDDKDLIHCLSRSAPALNLAQRNLKRLDSLSSW